jgi:hypothetical protein
MFRRREASDKHRGLAKNERESRHKYEFALRMDIPESST